tara:strand:- start:662 stop:1126 length:465 start_codon:yes stop_codon:yes gene_type:complete
MLIQIESGQPVGNPINEREFKSLHSNVSFTIPLEVEDVISRGYALYQESNPPETSNHELAERSTPVKVSNELWETGWSVRQMTPEESAKADADQSTLVRKERDSLLAQSDWTQFTDSPLSENAKTAWASYRDSLRNIPSQSGFPWDIIWPELPV